MTLALVRLVLALDMPPTRKLILLSLASRANGTGSVETTGPEIIRDTSLGERTVYRELAHLEERAFLQVQTRTMGRSARVTYHINPAAEAVFRDQKGAAEAAFPSETLPQRQHSPRAPAGSTHPHSQPFLVEEDSREEPDWIEDLYRLGFASSNRLTEREIERLIKDFGTLNIGHEIEEFVTYWAQPKNAKKIKAWSTYRHLRTWFRNSLKWEEERRGRQSRGSHVSPVRPEGMAGQYTRLRNARPDD